MFNWTAVEDFIKSNNFKVTCAVAGSALLFLSYRHYKWKKTLPPMPGLHLPYFGNPSLAKKLFSSEVGVLVEEAGKKLNTDVLATYAFGQTIVFCLSYDSFKECMVQNGGAVAGRMSLNMFNEDVLAISRGIVMAQGEVWQNHRQLVIRALKDLSLESSRLFEKIIEEARILIQKLSDLPQDNSKDLLHILEDSTASIISQLVFGHRFDNTALLSNLLTVNQDILSMFSQFDIKGYIPGMETNLDKLVETRIRPIINYIDNEIKLHENAVANDDVISIILEKRNVLPKLYTIRDVVATTLDLFFAGTKTTSDTLVWGIKHLRDNPETQELVRKELTEVLGDRALQSQDIEKLPKLKALVHEVLRFTSVVEVTVLHKSVQDFTLKGYHIPKGSIVAGVHSMILRDPKAWKHPNTFNIRNFLNADLTKFVANEYLIPFGAGPRKCIGERLAKSEIFVYLSAIIQAFEIQKLEDSSGYKEEKNYGCLGDLAVKFVPIS